MTITPDSPIYRKAFENYLRKGITPDVFIKATFDSPFYIWRTQHDDKVRPSHAANEGRACAWDAPPDTGNPGDDFGCRCHAEPADISKIASRGLLAIVVGGILIKAPASRRVAAIAARELVKRGILKPKDAPVEKPPQPLAKPFDRPKGVPKDWVQKPSGKGEGTKYVDPRDPKRGTDVRIQKGNPKNPIHHNKKITWYGKKMGDSWIRMVIHFYLAISLKRTSHLMNSNSNRSYFND
jgi:hypothetical protein